MVSNPSQDVVSSPIIRTDKQEANNILKKYNNSLKQEEKKIFHNNITPSHLNKDGLHLNFNGSTVLDGNLLSTIRIFWCNVDSNGKISLSNNEQHENDRINSSNYNSSMNNIPAISDTCTVNSVLRHLRLNHPQQIIMKKFHLNYTL